MKSHEKKHSRMFPSLRNEGQDSYLVTSSSMAYCVYVWEREFHCSTGTKINVPCFYPRWH